MRPASLFDRARVVLSKHLPLLLQSGRFATGTRCPSSLALLLASSGHWKNCFRVVNPILYAQGSRMLLFCVLWTRSQIQGLGCILAVPHEHEAPE
jgi:hypothetical protein